MDKLVVVILSLAAITATVWWFLGKKSSQQKAKIKNGIQQATITVEGGYKPEITELKSGIPAKITFIRKDASNCLEEIIIPDFGIQKKLTLNKPDVILLNDLTPGEYSYSCGMRMYHGKLVVK